MGKYFLDQYSLLHFAAGVVAYFWGIDFKLWLVLNIVFEIVENQPIFMNMLNNINIWPGGKSAPDSFINSIGDILCGMIGWILAMYLDDYIKKRKKIIN